MEIRGQIHCRRENTSLVLALALAVELLPPLGHIVKAWLIIGYDFNCLALAVQDVAHSRILKGRVGFIWCI